MAAKKTAGPQKVSGAELARVLAVSPTTVANWKGRGVPRRVHGRQTWFVVAEVVAWNLERAVADALSGKRPDGSIDMEEMRKRKMLADTEIAELALEEARAEVVPFDIVVAEVEDSLLRVRGKLLQMPTLYAGRWAKIGRAARMRTAVKAAVYEVLDELTDGETVAGVAREKGKASRTVRAPAAKRPGARRPRTVKKTT